MLALAVVAAVLLQAAAIIAAKGLGWGPLIFSAVILVPFAAILVFAKSPARWWEVGAYLGFIAGFMGGLALGWRWPVWDGPLAVLPGLVLAVPLGWITNLAGRGWLDPPARNTQPRSGYRAGPFLG